MLWQIPFTKTSGSIRTQFQQWSIPKAIREELGIVDGDYCMISVSHDNYRETVRLKITSGGEFRLPPAASNTLRRRANEHPGASVTFAIRIEDEAHMAAVAFEADVVASGKLKREARLVRLADAPKKPSTRIVETTIYVRNPDVVAEALYRAKGHCEYCGEPAPFLRRSDNAPYLEVHHIITLADGGDDTVENTQALCPNCHRRAHHGIIEEAEQGGDGDAEEAV